MADDQRRRRKDAGKRIQRARRAAGHRSQRSFADAIGYSESAVALAETGSERIGDGVFQAIEETLHMSPMVISTYIKTGDATLLDRIAYKSAAEEPAQRPPAADHGGPADESPLNNAIRGLVHTYGVDKATAAFIAVVREHDEEVRKQAERPDTPGDEYQQFE